MPLAACTLAAVPFEAGALAARWSASYICPTEALGASKLEPDREATVLHMKFGPYCFDQMALLELSTAARRLLWLMVWHIGHMGSKAQLVPGRLLRLLWIAQRNSAPLVYQRSPFAEEQMSVQMNLAV